MTDLGILSKEKLDRLTQLMRDGLDYIIVREKDKRSTHKSRLASATRRERLATFLIAYKKKFPQIKTKIIVHSDLDLARRIEADGVHFSMEGWRNYRRYLTREHSQENIRLSNDLNISQTSDTIYPSLRYKGEIGVSVHTKEELMSLDSSVTYAFVSPIFAPSCKEVEGKGVKWCQEMKSIAAVPVVALGGITKHNVASLYERGIEHVAVMSYLMKKESCLQDLIRNK